MHVAANTANLLSNVAARVEGAYGNECRKSEMIAAACATGVACCFSAPIGGTFCIFINSGADFYINK